MNRIDSHKCSRKIQCRCISDQSESRVRLPFLQGDQRRQIKNEIADSAHTDDQCFEIFQARFSCNPRQARAPSHEALDCGSELTLYYCGFGENEWIHLR